MGPVHFLFYTTEFYYYDVDQPWGKQRLLDQVRDSTISPNQQILITISMDQS